MNDFYIYGEITTQKTAEVAAFLNENKNVTLHINSAGGDILSAIAISNLIKKRADVKISVEGLAASAATFICSGAKVTAAKNSLFMLHLPLVELSDYYNAAELEKVQKALSAVKEAVISTYLNKLKMTEEEIEAAMAAETWLNAEQAKGIGLVDEITDAEIEMKLSADKKFVMVGDLKVAQGVLPEGVVKPEEQNLMKKFKQSVLTAERARVAALVALRNDSPAVNSIINKAIETGKTAEEIKPFVDVIKNDDAKNFKEFYKMASDNMQSGAENVTGSNPNDTDAEKSAFINNIAKFTNEILGVTPKG